MWLVRKFLAYLHIRRKVDITYNDGQVRQGVIVDESRTRFCIRALVQMGLTYRRKGDAWVLKTEPAIVRVYW